VAQRALPVPEPVLDTDGDVAVFSTELAAWIVPAGRLDGCVACEGSTVHALDVAGLVAAIDAEDERAVTVGLDAGSPVHRYRRIVPQSWRDGPALLGLHPACSPAVLSAWAWMAQGDVGPQRRDEPVAATRPATGAARRQGAYGRRRNAD
jgi:hypothetical protein